MYTCIQLYSIMMNSALTSHIGIKESITCKVLALQSLNKAYYNTFINCLLHESVPIKINMFLLSGPKKCLPVI